MNHPTPNGLVPEDDDAFLKEKFPEASVYRVGNEVHVLLPAFPFPAAYAPRTADLLVRLPAGYPDSRPDMFWTRQDVKLASGAWPTNAQTPEVPGSGNGAERYEGKTWQRWSRHTDDATWRAGTDGLRTFVRSIQRELDLGR